MSGPKKTRAKRANVTISKTDYLPNILKKLEDLTKQEVIIGAQGDAETAMIAAIHEFGSVKAGIPARSFIGSGRKKAQAAIGKLVRAGVTNLILHQETAVNLLNKVGKTGTEKMLANFDKIRTPPLSPIYARKKGNSKILVQEQKLRDAITFSVVPGRKR